MKLLLLLLQWSVEHTVCIHERRCMAGSRFTDIDACRLRSRPCKQQQFDDERARAQTGWEYKYTVSGKSNPLDIVGLH